MSGKGFCLTLTIEMLKILLMVFTMVVCWAYRRGIPLPLNVIAFQLTIKSEIIDNYLADELEAGALAEPFNEPPLTGTHTNRFGVIPKFVSDKWRLITDLSFSKREKL